MLHPQRNRVGPVDPGLPTGSATPAMQRPVRRHPRRQRQLARCAEGPRRGRLQRLDDHRGRQPVAGGALEAPRPHHRGPVIAAGRAAPCAPFQPRPPAILPFVWKKPRCSHDGSSGRKPKKRPPTGTTRTTGPLWERQPLTGTAVGVPNGGEIGRKSFGTNALRLRPQCQIQTYIMPADQFSCGIRVKTGSVASEQWGDLLATA